MDSNSVSAVTATTSNVLVEVLKAIPIIIGSLAAIVASIVAIYGINSWRHEFRGKRRIELAEYVLALFYQARDAIASIRNPLSMGDELSAPTKENESIEVKEAKDKVYFIFKRYKDREQLFSKLISVRYRFMAQIGADKVGPLDEIQTTVNEILITARLLANVWAKYLKCKNTKRQEEFEKKIFEYEEKIYWGLPEEDKISKRVDKAVADMEQICKPIILGQQVEKTGK
jgi:hypothetical protein